MHRAALHSHGDAASAARRASKALARRSWALALCACAWLSHAPAAFAQQAFGACPIEAYQTIQVGGTYNLYTVDVGAGTLVNQGTDTELQGNNAGNTNGINAIGFNDPDRFIYGWNNATRQLVRVGQNGVAAFVGPTPAGMPASNFVVGDILGGRLYLLGGGQIRILDIASNTLVQSIVTSGPGGINDWAFNPSDGQLYGVDQSGTVIRTNPATGVSVVVPGITVPSSATAFGAVYFDNQGSMYASRNDGSIFRIRNLAGGGTISVQTLTTSAPATGQNDGARCPNSAPPVASITVRKQLTAESGTLAGRAEANELLTYTFTLTNSGQLAGSNYPFFEVLPANTTLVSVSGGTIDCPIGSTGARLCTVTVPGPIAINGGTATASVVVRIDNPIPPGVTQILNLATDDNGTAPTGCSASNQPCAQPPTCSSTSDPTHCVILPLPSADLRVSKTNTPGVNGEVDQAADTVLSGSTVSYRIVVNNTGPDAANNAVLRDPIPTGLTCTAVTCGGATNGAVCPAVTVAALQSNAGVTIPTLPLNGSLTFTVTCSVP
ncbi:MAG: hypothetical protein ABJA62_00525 [Luteimonas sp.]